MGVTESQGSPVQSDVQKAFNFADKLHVYFPKISLGRSMNSADLRTGTFHVNTVLFNCLGKEKYVLFCCEAKQAYVSKSEHFTSDPFFKEEFADGISDSNTLFDNEVHLYWKLPEIMAVVQKLL